VKNIDFSLEILYTPIAVDSNKVPHPYMNKNISALILDKNTIEPIRFLVIGDWSYYNPLDKTMLPSITNCLNRLKNTQPLDYQGIIYVGDQAYDIDNSTNYVEFL
jgi:hypothetical protein